MVQHKIFALLIGGLGFLLQTLLIVLPIIQNEGAKFSSLVWKGYKDHQNYKENPRGEMVDELMDCCLETGQRKTHVQELLGKPDKLEEGRDYYYLSEWRKGSLWLILTWENDTLSHFEEFAENRY